MRQHLLRQSAKNTRPEFGCTTARKPGTARGCRERIGTAAATGVRQKRYGRPRKPCSQNRAAEIAAKAIDSQKSGAEPTAKRLTTKNRTNKNRCKGDRQPKSGAETAAKRLTTGNRTNKSRCKGNRQPKSNAEPTARQLTTGNRAGKVAARRLTAGNRSAETIDNRESGRRELPETAAARPLRRISRDGPRRRIPLPT